MTKRRIQLKGFAYRQGDNVEVYVNVDGKFLKLTGYARDAQRSHGRWTRALAKRKYKPRQEDEGMEF